MHSWQQRIVVLGQLWSYDSRFKRPSQKLLPAHQRHTRNAHEGHAIPAHPRGCTSILDALPQTPRVHCQPWSEGELRTCDLQPAHQNSDHNRAFASTPSGIPSHFPLQQAEGQKRQHQNCDDEENDVPDGVIARSTPAADSHIARFFCLLADGTKGSEQHIQVT